MRWLRSLRTRSHAPTRAVAFTELELALREPERHTRALVQAADDAAASDYTRVVAAMEQWPPRRWLALDAVRLETSYGEALAPRSGWSQALNRPESPTFLLVIASTHRDGFLRERATKLVADRPGQLASPALAVRAVDHVSRVQDVARHALDARRDATDAGAVVPILLAARRRAAAAGSLDRYVRGLSEQARRALIDSPDRETRRFAIDRSVLTAKELVRIAALDSDVKVRLAAAHRAIAEDGASAGELLMVRPASVRAFAASVAGL